MHWLLVVVPHYGDWIGCIDQKDAGSTFAELEVVGVAILRGTIGQRKNGRRTIERGWLWDQHLVDSGDGLDTAVTDTAMENAAMGDTAMDEGAVDDRWP